MNKSLLVLVGVLIMLIQPACKSKKAFHQAEKKELDLGMGKSQKALLLEKIETQQNGFNYYNGNGDLKYKDQNNKQELGINIIMQKDQFVYFNITALLGITVSRIMATNDSIVILDFLHRKALIADYSYLEKMTGVRLKLSNLQSLIIGNTLMNNQEKNCQIDSVGESIKVLQFLRAKLKQETIYAKSSLWVMETTIIDSLNNQSLQIDYSGFNSQGSQHYPSSIQVKLISEKPIDIVFDLKSISFDKKKEVIFSIPKSYEKVRL